MTLQSDFVVPPPRDLLKFPFAVSSLLARITAGSAAPLAILAGLAFVLLPARRRLAPTTLLTAWSWMLAVWISWTATALLFAAGEPSREIEAQALYWTGIVALCPGIAVLGAKRPGSQVWNLFILLPLLLVLGWPAATVWRLDGPRLFAVEIPVLVGLVLVLVMGTGNYLGTRYGLSALLYAAAVVSLIAPVTVLAPHGPQRTTGAGRPWFFLATLLLGLAAVLAWRACRSAAASRTRGPAQLWSDFRESFGIVWAKRLQDRLNQEAERESWSGFVTPIGLEWREGVAAEDRDRTEGRFLHHLTWLFRRFVDRSWIAERADQLAPVPPISPPLGAPSIPPDPHNLPI